MFQSINESPGTVFMGPSPDRIGTEWGFKARKFLETLSAEVTLTDPETCRHPIPALTRDRELRNMPPNRYHEVVASQIHPYILHIRAN